MCERRLRVGGKLTLGLRCCAAVGPLATTVLPVLVVVLVVTVLIVLVVLGVLRA
jgi:hypothetical protein